MRLRTTVVPAIGREPVYDGIAPETAFFAYACAKCGSQNEVGLTAFVDSSVNWMRELSGGELKAIEAHFGIRTKRLGSLTIRRSHEGGLPYLGLRGCGACDADNLLYLGFTERQPARYVAVLQGVAEVVS